ncbi:dienelactone hydrolase family protein [Vibrio sonorensis]|uniref:dienelactone hydrolase family protein n=1 Tax=Vibrio sonorensis TaxID=1004316 RepID=UPI0008D963B9|nr:alpha/beta fold hydrolase [Vibrio sonorensis]
MRITIALCLTLISFVSFANQSSVYNVNGNNYEGHWSMVSEDAPLILLVHDWDGLTDYEVKRSEMLNELGYNVFAVDLFGQGVRPTEIEDKRQHTGELYKDREKLRNLMEFSLAKAVSLGGDPNNVVVVGYCFGGAAALESARSGMKAKGFVTFHGGLKTPEGQSHQNTQAPILVLHGTADTAITMTDFANLAVELEENGVPHEMVTYSGAPHAFTVFDSPRYRQDADEKSWAKLVNFLEANTL